MKPITSLDEAISMIASYEGIAEDFKLPLADILIDPGGINMAVITDHILDKGWEPDGFVQKVGYRVYRYSTVSD